MPFVYIAIFLVALIYASRSQRRSNPTVQPDQATVPDVEDGKRPLEIYGTVWVENPTVCAMQLVGTEAIKA